MRQEIIYVLQYINLHDGKTYFHYEEFESMEGLTDLIQLRYGSNWTSYEIIVVKR